ncbi:ABC transporter permease [Halosimplex aquaticum]|uniref:ABC transporter permease n=1 Tax=Halosimplex aquaticum TaxID=3026162 RepID=A0ABD5XZM1_9EURY|nr:ABC transporter permease [Halosimplex aquaticum]
MRAPSRFRALVGIALAHLRHERVRTVITICGVAMAVLAAVLLASVGLGVIDTGQQKFAESQQDLWITGGPIELQPGTVGGFQNSVVDSHQLSREITGRDDVVTAAPMIFQSVYAGRNASELQTIVGVGAPDSGKLISLSAGRLFSSYDVHYANGSYDGPMTREAIIDSRTAELLDVGVNDTIHLGGTVATARQQEFTVVGISPTYSQFVGAPTVVLQPSELQEITGTTASDRASFVLVRATEGTNVTRLESELSETYPQYTIRTNQEQLRSILERQAVVLASGGSLLVLAVIAGVLLVMNIQLSFVFRLRESFAAITALGFSRRSLTTVVFLYTLCVGVLGGLLGSGLAVLGVRIVNAITEALTGFEDVASLSPRLVGGGLVLAVVVSGIGGVAASLYLARLNPLDSLR